MSVWVCVRERQRQRHRQTNEYKYINKYLQMKKTEGQRSYSAFPKIY